MDIRVYICDSAATLIETVAEIGATAEILYQTPDEGGETGLVKGYKRPATEPAETWKSFTNRYVVVARRS